MTFRDLRMQNGRGPFARPRHILRAADVVLVLAIAACRSHEATDIEQAAASSPRASLPALQVASVHAPTDGPRHSPTPTPTRTRTITATSTPEVDLSLTQAESHVASRFIPRNELRIHQSLYLTSKQGCAAKSDDSIDIWLLAPGRKLDLCESLAEHDEYGSPRVVRAPLFALVHTSYRGMEIRLPRFEQTSVLSMCEPVPVSPRTETLYWFDATTGDGLGVLQLGMLHPFDTAAWFERVKAMADTNDSRSTAAALNATAQADVAALSPTPRVRRHAVPLRRLHRRRHSTPPHQPSRST